MENKERENDIKALGYKVLRFSNDEVLYGWEEVEKKVREFFNYFLTFFLLNLTFKMHSFQNLKY